MAKSAGCEECESDSGMGRRAFLGLSAAAGAGVLATTTGGLFRQVVFAAGGKARNVIIVLSLRGGADGLSLVVPHGDPGYLLARPRLGIPAPKLVAADAMFGLHPHLAPLAPMWANGTFGAVHAVGLPQPNRSHFAALEAIEDADPGSTERRGWLNRLIELDRDHRPQQAVQLGDSMVPTSLYGRAPVLATSQLSRLKMPGPREHDAHAARVRAMHRLWDKEPGALGRGARSAMSSVKSLKALANNHTAPHNGAHYPAGEFGRSLADTARLIRADVGAEVVTLDYGNWDMHVGLGTLASGRMLTLADELGRGLAAFFKDLGPKASSVTVVTLSEFGRRVAENGDFGLDHGYGNVMLLLGAGVKGGQVHGRWPGLMSGSLIDGDLNVTRDYRSVLAEVVGSRFPGLNLSKVFPGFTREHVGAMRL